MKFIDRLKAATKAFTSPIYLTDENGKKTYYIPNSLNFTDFFDVSKTINTSTIDGQRVAFERCSAVSTVVARKVRAHLNGKYYLLDFENKEVNNPLAKQIKQLMEKPNLLQTWSQFEAQAKIYNQVFGECFILTISPAGYDKKTSITSMWVIPNWIITKQYSGKIYYQTELNKIIDYYRISSGNETYSNISPDKIIHIKDFFISSTNVLNGNSRLVSLQDPVNNIISAFNARKTLIKKRGAIGILSNSSKDSIGSIPLLPEDKEKLQAEFQQYGLAENQWQVVISNATLSWQSMTFPTKDLMLFEEVEDSTRAIADAYEYPMFLLGFKSGTTFSNVAEAKKSLYQDCIIPEANSFIEAFNKYFNCEANGFTIQVFFDHLDIFQQSEKEKAEAYQIKSQTYLPIYEKGIITLNQYLTEIEYDTLPDGDKYIYDIQKTPLAIKFGVGGTQALQAILVDPNLTPENKKNILIVLFGLSEQEAKQIMG